jgi:hypothetical protein
MDCYTRFSSALPRIIVVSSLPVLFAAFGSGEGSSEAAYQF